MEPLIYWLVAYFLKYFKIVALSKVRDPTELGVPSPHLKTETNPVSETLCFLVFGGQLIAVSSKGPNRVGVSLPSPEAETDSVSETSCFLVFRIPDNGQSPEI
jgi:hypothetical protein